MSHLKLTKPQLDRHNNPLVPLQPVPGTMVNLPNVQTAFTKIFDKKISPFEKMRATQQLISPLMRDRKSQIVVDFGDRVIVFESNHVPKTLIEGGEYLFTHHEDKLHFDKNSLTDKRELGLGIVIYADLEGNVPLEETTPTSNAGTTYDRPASFTPLPYPFRTSHGSHPPPL